MPDKVNAAKASSYPSFYLRSISEAQQLNNKALLLLFISLGSPAFHDRASGYTTLRHDL